MAIIVWLVAIGLAVVVAGAYLSGRTGIALGALFAGASFSGITAPLGDLNARVEMPALALLATLILWRQPRALLRYGGMNLGLLAAAILYIAPQVASSTLLAEQPLESLRIVAWLGLSMIGMAVAVILVASSSGDLGLPRWIVWAAAIQVTVGLGSVVSQAFFGTTWGVQAGDVVFGKTRGLSWEANILAINLAMALAFLIPRPASDRTPVKWYVAGLVWLSVGLGLAYSRGGLIALSAAATAAAIGLAWIDRGRLMAVVMQRVLPMTVFTVVALVIAIATVQVQAVLGDWGVGWTPATVFVEDVEPPDPSAPPPDPSAPPPDPSALPSAEPIRYVGTGDTIALRLEHVRIAMDEVVSSPLIGLGTDSYRQRHNGSHVSALIIATLYEGGVLALAGLTAILGVALRAAWKLRLWGYLAALVVLIVGYQVTDAFRFASNWILIGAVVGLWTASRLRQGEQPPTAEPR